MEDERIPLREARITLAVQVRASAIGYGTPRAVAPAGHLRIAMGHARPSPKEGCCVVERALPR
ncbi:MAG: hypothetical protein ACRDS9_17985, partial [Pseudonocardiaceae bacterium]